MILLILLAVILGGAYFAYRTAFYSPADDREGVRPIKSTQYDPYRPRMKEIFENLKARPFERVSVTSFDGLTLSGRYYHVADGAPLDLCFHGYRSSPLVDFSGGSELSFQLGHNVLMIEQRAHCGSEGKTITFGILERRDLLTWVDYAIERFGDDVQIILQGVSMGGATVLMASEFDLPGNVKGIVADCPFSSPVKIISDVGKASHYPALFTVPFSILGARIFGGFNLLEITAEKAVKHTKVPILIIHGGDDRFVPCENSLSVRDANPEMVTHYTIPGAAHGIAYLVDTPFYKEKVCEFLHKILN